MLANITMYVAGDKVCEYWECLFGSEPWLELLADCVLYTYCCCVNKALLILRHKLKDQKM